MTLDTKALMFIIVAVLLLCVPLLLLELDFKSPISEKENSFVRLAPTQDDPLLNEYLELFSQEPSFLPTRWNYQSAMPQTEYREASSQLLVLYPEVLTPIELLSQSYPFAQRPAVPQTPVDMDEVPILTGALAPVALLPDAPSPQGVEVVVKNLLTNETTHTERVTEWGTVADDLQPSSVHLLVYDDGSSAAPYMVKSSGYPGQDLVYSDWVSRNAYRWQPGYYKVEFGL